MVFGSGRRPFRGRWGCRVGPGQLALSGFCPTERVQGAGLPVERAILHGKLGEHEQALRILVHELGDTTAAEDYCLWGSEGQDVPCRRHLFHTLLATYLQAGPAAPRLTVAAVDLLNRHAADFDAAHVLQLLPGSWSVQLLGPFLTGAVRGSIHARRTAQVALGLARSENLLCSYDKVGAGPLMRRAPHSSQGRRGLAGRGQGRAGGTGMLQASHLDPRPQGVGTRAAALAGCWL